MPGSSLGSLGLRAFDPLFCDKLVFDITICRLIVDEWRLPAPYLFKVDVKPVPADKNSEADILLNEILDPKTPHERRAVIGQRLSVLGDPRPGVGVGADGLPDIVWLPVDEGKVILEHNLTVEYEVRSLYISRYLITYAQFQAFVDSGGYGDERWWYGLPGQSAQPAGQEFKFSSHPRDMVNWFEAMAFCRWLNARLRQKDGDASRSLPAGIELGPRWQVRLPTEPEWHLAATGGDMANTYPWGPAWDSGKANTIESNLGRTTAVGMYPHGAACYRTTQTGPLDMSGNVWEWCLNGMDISAGPELPAETVRARHGGSWRHDRSGARCAYRNFVDLPHERYNNNGFRVALGPPY